MTRSLLTWSSVAALIVALVAPTVWAAEADQETNWLAMVQNEARQAEVEVNEVEVEKRIPISFSIQYTLATDYVWRGANLSEYPGEGTEDLNHQLGTTLAYDTGRYGVFAANVWFEWFAGQDQLTPDDEGDHLQEVDYTLSWAYEIEPLYMAVELGWIAYHFPRIGGGDAQCTQEVYGKLYFNDGVLFGMEEPVLQPFIAYYYDYDDVNGGQWIEGGVSHDFELDQVSYLRDVPFVRDLVVTPSLVLGVSHRYWSTVRDTTTGRRTTVAAADTTRLANLVYGLAFAYDLGKALNVPDEYGSLGLGAFVNYSQAFFDEALDDVLYGGLTVLYEW